MLYKEGSSSSRPAYVGNLFDLVNEQARHTDSTRIPVFKTDRQQGSLFLSRDCLQIGNNVAQQTLHVLRGEARMRIRGEDHDVRKGGLAVIPPGEQASFSDAEDLVVFSIASPSEGAQAGPNRDKSSLIDPDAGILVTNVYDLYHTEKQIPFMSTTNANGNETDPSAVQEIEVFSPQTAKKGVILNGSQAARILIYKEPTELDRHTHPEAQHAINVLEGRGRVAFAQDIYDLTPGGLFVIPPKTVHQLGSPTHFLGLVVNSPGIPPTDPHYSTPA